MKINSLLKYGLTIFISSQITFGPDDFLMISINSGFTEIIMKIVKLSRALFCVSLTSRPIDLRAAYIAHFCTLLHFIAHFSLFLFIETAFLVTNKRRILSLNSNCVKFVYKSD